MKDEQHSPLITSLGPILVTKAELAKALMVSERTVGNWQHNGVIPFLKLSDRFVRFDIAKVQKALDQRYEVQAKAKAKAGVGR